MKKKFFFGCTLTLFFIVGCSNAAQEEAEQIIIEQNSTIMGTPEIISTEKKDGEYYIEWINEKDGSKGINKVSADGEITVIEAEVQ